MNIKKTLIDAPIIITTHCNADYDALASMVAVSKIYPNSVLIFPGSQERSIQSLFLQNASIIFDFHTIKEINIDSVKTLVVVDTRQKSRLLHIHEVLKNTGLAIHLYDHHPEYQDTIHGDFESIKPWGATTSIIIHELIKRKITLSKDEATMLGLGIYEDTGSFTFSSTTEYDFTAATWLLTQNMDLVTISELVSRELTTEQISILHTLLESATTHEIKGVPIIIAEASMETFMGDFAHIVHKMMDMSHTKVLFAIVAMDEKIQVVGRSKISDVDVGRICTSLGGGGHFSAASASIKNKTLAQVKDALFGLIYSSINPDISIKRLMSFPVHAIDEDSTLQQAEEVMVRSGLKSIPILAKGTNQCIGLLEYQLAVRALTHNLGSFFVSEYMQRNIRTVSPESTLYPVMEIILDERQRLVPVVENEDIVGVITRTDLINILVNEPSRIPESLMPDSRREKNISHLLTERLPKEYLSILNKVGDLGDQLGINVYVVGGFVRDLIMGCSNFDIDIVVEGDAIEFAKVLAQNYNGRIRSHYTFKTALVILPATENREEFRIDVATARLEYYEHPAALPTVELSSIKMDLYRRDFTINALAICLNNNNYGGLVDFFGSQRDIKDKVIRVLHSLSFIEDPTRILRAIRFESRFKFQITNQTERLIKNALSLELLQKLSGIRLFNELKIITEEVFPRICFNRMESFNILQLIHPVLKYTPLKDIVIQEMEKVIAWYDLLYLSPKLELWKAYFLCLCGHAKYPDVSNLTERLKFSRNMRQDFLTLRENIKYVQNKLNLWNYNKGKVSELYTLLSSLAVEGLLFLMATSNEDIRRPISLYLTRLKDTHLDIIGLDLTDMGGVPGPIYKQVLDEVLAAKLDGEVTTRNTQLNYAHSLLIEKINNSLK